MQKPQLGALFDVKPVDDSGLIDFERISAVGAVINLSQKKRAARKIAPAPEPEQKEIIPEPEEIIPEPLEVGQKPVDAKEEFESVINQDADIHFELASYGIQAHQLIGKPRYKPVQASPKSKTVNLKQEPQTPDQFDAILSEIHYSRAAASKVPEMSSMVALEKPVRSAGAPAMAVSAQPVKVSFLSKSKTKKKKFRLSRRVMIVSGIVILALAILAAAGWALKRHVTDQGQAAVSQLESAKTDLEAMKFDNASDDFTKAYQSFSKAGDGLNFMGATISGLIADLPGGGTVKSAQNLVQIGKLVADSGAAMTKAAKAMTDGGSVFLPGTANASTASISSVMDKLQKALSISAADVKDIKALLADTDPSIIPADKREAFDQLSALVPTLEQVVGHGADYAKFFADASGQPGTHRYLILFENSAELRPTGGFPGSYGVVTFTDGKLTDFFVDDIYNPDGQIKQPVVPPGPLQHITPDWGMRDANWFPDFPTSARVIEEFYPKERNGQTVDGVITVNPNIVTDILKITGPISMPKYGLTLSSDNFINAIQNQIEYVADRAQPKEVLTDFAPLLLEKLRAASSDQWMAIFNSVIAGMDKNNVLMYFNNLQLENFADNQGFAGQLYQGQGDYVMPVISNVKGSKSDAVTDTSLSMTTTFDGNDAVHTLTITRTHNGGDSKYAFYNKKNPAYIRVLVPTGAQLVSIDGQDQPAGYGPLVNYAKIGFATNQTLAKWEASAVAQGDGITSYQESGKTEFGFWLLTDPGQTKTVTLTYRVPNAVSNGAYNLYFQKQPGLVVKDSSITAGSYSFKGPLDKDLPIKIQLP